jgi:hypothetical protein
LSNLPPGGVRFAEGFIDEEGAGVDVHVKDMNLETAFFFIFFVQRNFDQTG